MSIDVGAHLRAVRSAYGLSQRSSPSARALPTG
jgi:hypothetical protein